MQELTLIIGNKNYSSWSLRPWLFMRKNNVSFNEEIIWFDTPDFKELVAPFGSNGTVPALLDGETQVWDSLAIIDYLCATRELAHAWPKQTAQLALARSMSAEMHSGYFALRNELSMDTRLKTPHKIKAVACQADIDRIVLLWEQALSMNSNQGGWLFGEFCAADAMFAPVVLRLNSYSITVPDDIARYIDFVLNDDAIAEWVEAASQEVILPNH